MILRPPSREPGRETSGRHGTPAHRGDAQQRLALRAFMDFQIPEDLSAGYGYPQLTDQAKRKILGENLLRLHGLDVEETKARLSAKP